MAQVKAIHRTCMQVTAAHGRFALLRNYLSMRLHIFYLVDVHTRLGP